MSTSSATMSARINKSGRSLKYYYFWALFISGCVITGNIFNIIVASYDNANCVSLFFFKYYFAQMKSECTGSIRLEYLPTYSCALSPEKKPA